MSDPLFKTGQLAEESNAVNAALVSQTKAIANCQAVHLKDLWAMSHDLSKQDVVTAQEHQSADFT